MENMKKQNYTNKILTILFLLIPFFYFTGPLLSDLTVIVIILLFLFNFQNNYLKKKQRFNNFNSNFFSLFVFKPFIA